MNEETSVSRLAPRRFLHRFLNFCTEWLHLFHSVGFAERGGGFEGRLLHRHRHEGMGYTRKGH